MRTAKEYRESLYRMRPNLHIRGEKAGRDDPRLQPALDLIATSYDLAHQPETKELFSATSSLTGNKISRFARLYYTQEDLIKKLEAVRFLTRKIGYCAMRCGGERRSRDLRTDVARWPGRVQARACHARGARRQRWPCAASRRQSGCPPACQMGHDIPGARPQATMVRCE